MAKKPGTGTAGSSGYTPGPPSAKKSFNLASKLKAAGAALLGGTLWTLKQVFSKKGAAVALIGIPTLFGMSQCTNPEVNPTHDQILTKTSADAFMEGAGSVYSNYKDWTMGSVIWTFDQLRDIGVFGPADDNTFSDPKSILICHPNHKFTIVPPSGENIDPTTRKYSLISQEYYNKMEAEIGSIISDPNHRLNENMREHGWHPVIKYPSVHSEAAGDITIEFKETPREQNCGSNAYTPVRVPVTTSPN
jgi:hypothetical protein